MAVLLGKTSVGTTADFSGTGLTAAWDHVAVASGTLVKISAQTKVSSNASSTTWRLGIYADSAGVPGALLGVGNVDTGTPTGTGLFSATITPGVTINSGTTYWLAWYALDAGDTQVNFQGDAGGNYFETATARNFADPFGTRVGPSTTDALIYGEDAGVVPVMAESFQAIPFM